MAYLSESIPLTEHEFILLRDLIQENLGLTYDAEKRAILQDRLAPLVAERKLDSFLDYYYLLKYDPCGQAEWLRVQSALAVRETYFWREVDQIQVAANGIIPELQRREPMRTIRILHAACASGEEPYSMAIALEMAGCFRNGRIEIVGADFDQDALEAGRSGIYRERSFRALPVDLRSRYFSPVENGTSRLADEIRSRVTFLYVNLADRSSLATLRDFDVIFCRNVFIYFNEATIQQVAEGFYQALRNPGYLFLGASESLLRVPTRFELSEMSKTFAYLKNSKG